MRNLISKTKRQEIKSIKNRLSNVIIRKICKFSNKYWLKKLKDLKIQYNSLWKTARSYTKNNNRTIPILHGLNRLAISNREKVEQIASNFEKVLYLTDIKKQYDFCHESKKSI